MGLFDGMDLPSDIRAELQREDEGSVGLVVRRDCAFCGRERSHSDDNHAPECPYWDFFGGTR